MMADRSQKILLGGVAAACAIVPGAAIWLMDASRDRDHDSLSVAAVLGLVNIIAAVICSAIVYRPCVAKASRRIEWSDAQGAFAVIGIGAAAIGLLVTNSPILAIIIGAGMIGARSVAKGAHSDIEAARRRA